MHNKLKSNNITLFAASLVSVFVLAKPALADQPDVGSTQESRATHFLSSSLFMLFNFAPDPPSFYQLNYGHRITPRDTLIVEAITWTYAEPIGIPWGKGRGAPENALPGHARDIGVGLAYQRFWWRGLYTTLHATPFFQMYFDQEGEHIQSGFQLFMTARLGYHFEFWKNRLFIEPSIAATAWPINTNLPDTFAAQEERWRPFFLGEPGLHFGVNF